MRKTSGLQVVPTWGPELFWAAALLLSLDPRSQYSGACTGRSRSTRTCGGAFPQLAGAGPTAGHVARSCAAAPAARGTGDHREFVPVLPEHDRPAARAADPRR